MATSKKCLTNEHLNRLLLHLGFEPGETVKKVRRVWRHREAETVIVLPANKSDEQPLQVDLISVRTHLDANGLLDADVFDEFVKGAELPQLS